MLALLSRLALFRILGVRARRLVVLLVVTSTMGGTIRTDGSVIARILSGMFSGATTYALIAVAVTLIQVLRARVERRRQSGSTP